MSAAGTDTREFFDHNTRTKLWSDGSASVVVEYGPLETLLSTQQRTVQSKTEGTTPLFARQMLALEIKTFGQCRGDQASARSTQHTRYFTPVFDSISGSV